MRSIKMLSEFQYLRARAASRRCGRAQLKWWNRGSLLNASTLYAHSAPFQLSSEPQVLLNSCFQYNFEDTIKILYLWYVIIKIHLVIGPLSGEILTQLILLWDSIQILRGGRGPLSKISIFDTHTVLSVTIKMYCESFKSIPQLLKEEIRCVAWAS